MAEYIDRDKILFELFEAYDGIDPRFLRGRAIREAIALIKKEINTMPAADVVSKGAYDQVLWERDIAVRQLREDYGVDLGEKKHADVVSVVRCRDCRYLMFSDCYGECRRGNLGIVRPDDHCSYGKRKEKP